MDDERPISGPKRLRLWMTRQLRRPVLSAVAAALIAAGLYGSTLMRTVSGCAHEYCADSGEFQVALALWGTVHYTGYPLYMMLGSALVAALRHVGMPPAAGASLYSLLWEALAIGGTALITERLTRRPWLALGAALLLAVMRPIWIHGSIPEVYSLGLAISVGLLWLALDLREQWSDRKGWLLAFLAGLGVAHHRLTVLLLLAVGLYTIPAGWRAGALGRWRWLGVATMLFLMGLLPYLDMPLRVRLGSTWNYGRPETWVGFWDIFWAQEVAGLQRPNFDPHVLADSARRVLDILAAELTTPGLAAVAVAAVAAMSVPRTRPAALLLSGAAALYVLFSTFVPSAVLVEANLILPLLSLIVLMALGITLLPERWQVPLGLAMYGWSALIGTRHYPFVASLTLDPTTAKYVERTERLEAPLGAVIMAPWGPSYFALSYAQRVEGRLQAWTIVDHRANFEALADASGGRIFTSQETLYVFGRDWWASRLGSPLRVTSAGPGLVALSAGPLDPSWRPPLPIGDGLALIDWEIRPANAAGEADIVLYWTATRLPTADYSTFVHVTDQDEIVTLEDLAAQSDYVEPVYGWYPTSQWQPNEVVREDHAVMLPPDRPARTIIAGMYSRDAAGNLIRLGQVAIRQEEGTWQAVLAEP